MTWTAWIIIASSIGLAIILFVAFLPRLVPWLQQIGTTIQQQNQIPTT